MKLTLILSILFLIVMITSGVAFAQPPGMPSAPSQAPIDGGLGLLAAAGGAYAIKKLKGKKNGEVS